MACYNTGDNICTYDSGGAGSLPGGGSPDYSMLETWETDTGISLSARVILDCYDSQDHDDCVLLNSASNESAWTRNRMIRSSPDCATPWAGKKGTGAHFEYTGGNRYVLEQGYPEQLGIFQNISVTYDGTNTANNNFAMFAANGSGSDPTVFAGCVACNGQPSSGKTTRGFQAWDGALFLFCIAYNNNDCGFSSYVSSSADTYAQVCCTSAENDGAGFNVDGSSASAYVWSCFGGGNDGDDFEETAEWDVCEWNVSADATADNGGAASNYQNSTDLRTKMDTDFLPTEPIGYGRNPYNDFTVTYDADDYIYDGSSHEDEFELDITGKKWAWDTVDAPIDVGAGQWASDTVSFSIDALIQKTGIAQTVSLDAMIQNEILRTLNLDSMVQDTMNTTVSVDALIQAVKSGAISIDALVAMTGRESVSVDALIQAVRSGTLSIDAMIQSTGTAGLGLDAIIISAIGSTALMDALIQAVKTGAVSLDAYIAIAGSGTVSVDALIQALQIGAVSIDALIQSTITGSLALDAKLQKPFSSSISMDAFVFAAKSGAISIDALVALTGTTGVSIDALVAGVATKSISIDAFVAVAGGNAVALDAMVQATHNGAVSLDALILFIISSSTMMDALIAATGSGYLYIDAIVAAAKAGAVSIDALVATVRTGGVSLDAVLREIDYVLRYRSRIASPVRCKTMIAPGRVKTISAAGRVKIISSN